MLITTPLCVSDQLRQCCHGDSLLEPSLLGECIAHSGSVQGISCDRRMNTEMHGEFVTYSMTPKDLMMFLDFDHEGLVTCGGDNLVIVWKNAEMQKIQRNQKVQEILLACDGIV